MADTRTQLVVEDWVREKWMPAKFARDFQRRRVDLATNGKGRFDFDAVAMDGQAAKIVASISTSGRSTASGKLGTGKLHKLRSDMLFLLLAKDVEQRLLVLTERDMYELCVKEQQEGRVPKEIEIHLAELPVDLADSLRVARETASREVSPR